MEKVAFKELKPGDRFLFEGSEWITSRCYLGVNRAVSLRSGMECHFGTKKLVEPLTDTATQRAAWYHRLLCEAKGE